MHLWRDRKEAHDGRGRPQDSLSLGGPPRLPSATEAEIAAALTGHDRPEHRLVLQQNLELFDALLGGRISEKGLFMPAVLFAILFDVLAGLAGARPRVAGLSRGDFLGELTARKIDAFSVDLEELKREVGFG